MANFDSDDEESLVEASEASDLLVWNAITSNKELLSRLGEQDCVVLPPNDGLPKVLTTVFLKHHMLSPSPLFKGQYITWELEDALVENRDDLYLITIGSGWKYSCKARVIKVDTFYNNSGMPYKVVFTNRHLLSGGDKLYGIVSKEGRQHPDRLNTPTSQEDVETLMPKLGISDLLSSISKSFLESYIMLPGCSDNVQGRVMELFDSCSEKVQNKIAADQTVPLTSRNIEVLHCASTLFVVARIHQKLWPYWVKENEQEDSAIRTSMMALLRHGSVAHLMGDPRAAARITNSKLVPAATQLRKTIDRDNPMEMLDGIKTCIDSLLKVASDAATDPQDVTADDVIPILTFAICLSKIGCLESFCSYCLNFSPESLLQSELGYALTSVQAAIALILQEGKQFIRSSGLPLSEYKDVGFIFPSKAKTTEEPSIFVKHQSAPALRTSGGYGEPPTMFSKHHSSATLRSSGGSTTSGTPYKASPVTTPVRQTEPSNKVKKVSSLIDPQTAKESGDFLKSLLGS